MIEFCGVKKSFKGNQVLKNFNMVARAGMINCLVGKNGAGKSTLVNLAMGLLKLDGGEVRILGQKIDRRNRGVLRKVGFVLEELSFVESFSAREQLTFMGTLYNVPDLKNRVNELIDFFDLPADNKKLITQCSTGTQAKVSLACAIIHKPEVLVLDEPFNGLDLPSYDKVLSYLKSYVINGNCVLITTHHVDVIMELSDYVALLKNGELQFNYSFRELQERADIYKGERAPIKKYLSEQLADI